MNIVIAGFWQLYRAVTQIWQLKQSFFYLIDKFCHLRLGPKITRHDLLIFQATSSLVTR